MYERYHYNQNSDLSKYDVKKMFHNEYEKD